MLLFFPHCLVDQDLKRQAIHGSWAVHGILEGKVDLATGALGLSLAEAQKKLLRLEAKVETKVK